MNDFFKWWGTEMWETSWIGIVLMFVTYVLAMCVILAFSVIGTLAILGTWQPLTVVVLVVCLFIYRAYAQSRKEK